jgi:5-methylcytosine-specific restriction endonuclease McrA
MICHDAANDIDFWAPRACFLPPIPEVDRAAELLAEAADALLAANCALALERLRQADMPVVSNYATMIMGRYDLNIHRKRNIDIDLQKGVRVKQRMPSPQVERSMYSRDGWRCRFCGCRVVLKPARDRMAKLLPGAIRLGPRAQDCHAAFLALSAVPDHIIPHTYGGTNDLDNLVTACWPCNNGRGSLTLNEVGLIDPRSRPPLVDGWDGLGRMLGQATDAPQRRPHVMHESALIEGIKLHGNVEPTTRRRQHDGRSSEDAWFAELNRTDPTLSSRLLNFLRNCEDLDVSWSLKKILIVRMKVGGIATEIFGVDRNADVHIPWAIHGQKDKFRNFAENIAKAIPGAIAYETPKSWNVSKFAKKFVKIEELLDASQFIHMALEELHTALRRFQ